MHDEDKSREQLIKELQYLQKKVDRLEQERNAGDNIEQIENKTKILHEIAEVVIYQDINHKILWANQAAGELLNTSPGILQGCYCYRLWQGRNRPCRECPVQKCITTGARQDGEICAPGGTLWQARCYPVRDDKGEITGAVQIMLDITGCKEAEKHRQAEIALRRRNKLLTVLSQSATRYLDFPFGAVDYRLMAQDLLKLTGAACVLFGSYNEETGQIKIAARAGQENTAAEIIKYIKLDSTQYKMCLVTGELYSLTGLNEVWEPEFFEKKLSTREIYVTGLVNQNRILGKFIIVMPEDRQLAESMVVEIFCNLSAATLLRKKVEKSLWESQERYRSFIEHTRDALLVANPEGRYIEVNPAACRMLGYERNELLQMGLEDILPPFYQGYLSRSISKLKKNGVLCSEITLKSKEGRKIPVELNATVLPDGNYLGTLRDITGRKRNEDELKRTITELQRTRNMLRDREKLAIIGQVAAGVAHEIKNPMTTIRGFAQLLKEKECTGEEIYHFASTILEEVDQANNVVSEFLQLANPKQPDLQQESVNLLLEEIIAIVEPEALRHNIDVVYRGAKELPRCKLDREQIKQVLVYICRNAYEAMPRGGLVKIGSGFLPDKNEVYIEVQDTGCGITRDKLDKIWMPFYTSKAQGTGLSLSICKLIIDNHGGRVEVDSKEQAGTRFRVYLPC